MGKMLIALALPLILLCGCTADKGKELFDTAMLEEQQHNTEHAIKLYEELVLKYPDSALASPARGRLSVLKQGK